MADKKNCLKPGSHEVAASYQNKGTLKTMGNIVKHRGFSGLYTGFGLHLSEYCLLFLSLWKILTRLDSIARDTLGTAMYFITYESSKQLLTTFGGDGSHNNPFAVLIAGGMCGIVSWALICKQ